MAFREQERGEMLAKLGAYCGVPMQRQNSEEALTSYPFLVWSVQSAQGKMRGTACAENGQVFRSISVRWSFTACAAESDEAMALAARAQDFLCEAGIVALGDLGLAVESVGEVQNRDIFLTVGYEHREGFEVQLAAVREMVPDEEDGGVIETGLPTGEAVF